MIRHEEALGTAVRAAPPCPADRVPEVKEPDRGQTYFKLALDPEGVALELLFRRRRQLRLPLVGDRAAFFDHWLHERYRRARYEKERTAEADDGPSDLVVGFPTLYLSRRGELLTLLRFSAEQLAFFDERGELFTPPGTRARLDGRIPPPPAEVAIVAPELDAELPYAVDENVLSRNLGVQEEHVGLLARWLRDEGPHGPEAVVYAVTVLLELDPSAAVSSTGLFAAPAGVALVPDALLARLVSLCRARAIGDLSVFPVGLAWDGGAVYATHHLQRDLDDLLVDGVQIPRASALSRYLLREPRPARRTPHLGTYSNPLTPLQREVAERFLGSTLTVAEGPPGTGKTALILALAAHTVIERHAAEDTFGEIGTGPMLLVASTNNRAVDNVIDPLSADLPEERLPVALRVGSRTVLSTTTRALIERTLRWLSSARVSAAGSEPAKARDRFRDATRAYTKAQRSVDAARTAAARHADALRERVATSTALDAAERRQAETAEEDDPAQFAEALVWTQAALRIADRQINHLAKKGASGVAKSSQKWASLRDGWPEVAAGILQRAGKQVAFQAPAPDDDTDPEEWESAWELLRNDLIGAIQELMRRVNAADADLPEIHREKLAALDAEIESLASRSEKLPGLEKSLVEERQSIEEGLFDDALVTRELWAASNASRLIDCCKAILRELDHRGSLRPLAERDTTAWRDLQRLFPVWGCTLLSVPNVFPIAADSIARAVIDEAGQCHPAHAVTALRRAAQVLLIGDTNQLEPVVELDAREEHRVIRRTRGFLVLDRLGPYRSLSTNVTSAQSLAAEAVFDVPRLKDHFRCQAEIIAISNRLCDYDLRVHTPRASLSLIVPRLRAPVLGIDVRGGQEAFLGSWRNHDEVRAAIEIVAELVRFGVSPSQIALLTPYRGQLRALRDALKRAGLPFDDGDIAPADAQGSLFTGFAPPSLITTGTVHRFQGGERDVVVFSSVVTETRSLGFMNQRRNLVNVAVSRARLHFLLVGHAAVLQEGPITRELVAGVGPRGWL